MRFSNSMLKDYAKCPLLFYYRHILKLNLETKSIHLVFGKALHSALEGYHKDQSDPVVIFKKEFRKEEIPFEDFPKYEETVILGETLLTEYLKTDLSTQKQVTQEEVYLFKNEFDFNGIKLDFDEIKGIIDFELDDAIIGDYKTSSHKYTQEEIDTTSQPTIYYLLYWLKYKKLPKAFRYVIFLKKRKKEPIQVLDTHRTEKDIEEMLKQINQLFLKIKNREFSPSHGVDSYCDCHQYTNLLKI